MINLSALSIDYLARPTRRHRSVGGDYNNDGDYVGATKQVTSIKAVIQPTPGNERKDLPEDIRDEADYVFWTRADLLLDDVLEEGGQFFRVMFLCPRRDGGFYRAVGCKLPDNWEAEDA